MLSVPAMLTRYRVGLSANSNSSGRGSPLLVASRVKVTLYSVTQTHSPRPVLLYPVSGRPIHPGWTTAISLAAVLIAIGKVVDLWLIKNTVLPTWWQSFRSKLQGKIVLDDG